MSFVLSLLAAAAVLVFCGAALAVLLAVAVLGWLAVLDALRDRRMKRLQELKSNQ